jgi:chromosome segregation ATPase
MKYKKIDTGEADYHFTKEEVELDEAGMKEIDTVNQEIKRLRVKLQQLRDSENAAAGGDTTSIEKQIHQTRSALLDLQKKALENSEKKVEVKEGKMSYKSYKKSLKKEEENLKNMKSTLTGKPVTKIDVEPKLAGHN